MPLEGEHEKDIGLETPEGSVCQFDLENGEVKNPAAIFEGGVRFFTEFCASGDRELGEKLTRKNMKALPYWQTRSFAELDGPEATEEEFMSAMNKLRAV